MILLRFIDYLLSTALSTISPIITFTVLARHISISIIIRAINSKSKNIELYYNTLLISRYYLTKPSSISTLLWSL
jgi:hypothetical protein